MSGRAEIERAILDEEAMLEQVVHLLERGAALTEWPAPLRDALALALAEPATSPTEGWKAVTLRRHLFGPGGSVPSDLAAPRAPSIADRRRAEHLRSGLPALVRYRAARYLGDQRSHRSR